MADPNQSAPPAAKAPLDDVMMAMDVVDTLRHDIIIAEREMAGDERRQDLLARLRALYRSQGIEVPDEILEEGVRALEQDRFTYEPPRGGLGVWLARLYVARLRLAKTAAAGIAIVALLWGGWYMLVERPRIQLAQDLRVALPQRLDMLVSQITAEAEAADVSARARVLASDGRAAAAAANDQAARSAEADLRAMLSRLRETYDIRIVTREGVESGVWREPRVNETARNYYLIVEAVNPRGEIIARDIANEETGRTERVERWGVRVPERVWQRVRADKSDDGIIQDVLVATKARGKMEPDWRIEVSGGAITGW